MLSKSEAEKILLAELSERGFVKLEKGKTLRGLTDEDVKRASKLSDVIDSDLKEQIKNKGHFESKALNRYADIYYLSPLLKGKPIIIPELDRLERVDVFDQVVFDFEVFCLYVDDILQLIE